MKIEEKVDFESVFAKMVDRNSAPSKIAWMAKKGTFTYKEYNTKFKIKNSSNASVMWYIGRGLLRIIHKGNETRGKITTDPTIYQWIGPL